MSMLRTLPLILLAGGCAGAPSGSPIAADEGAGMPSVANRSPQADLILGIERLANSGPFFMGTQERFGLQLDVGTIDAVEWTASGGEITGQGTEVTWLLPDQREASLTARVIGADVDETATFYFGVVPSPEAANFVDPGAQGQVDPTPDTISNCRLTIDSSDVPHVVYRNATHGQLWHAEWDGSDWDLSLVDGPGFDVGSTVTTHFDLALDTGGTPHIAYEHVNNDVWYATPGGLSWTREQVTDLYTENAGRYVAIALDPAHSNAPVVAWTHVGYDYYSDDQPVLAWRDGGVWTEERYTDAGTYDYFLGDLAFDGTGTAWLPYNTSGMHTVQWSRSGGWVDQGVAYDSSSVSTSYARIELDTLSQPILLNEEGVEHLVGSTWIHSEYESFDTSNYDLASYQGSPRIAVRHNSQLEFIEVGPENYWVYSWIDDMDGARPSIAVDSAGDSHACYIKDSQVWFY